jgi:hypothetical protein
MITNTYGYYVDLSALDTLTCNIAINHAADATPEFRDAISQLRKHLTDEQARIGEAVENECRRSLRARNDTMKEFRG